MMRRKYEDIKKKNELEHKKIVQEMREIQFKNNTDEIRTVNKKAYEMKTQIEREIQMIEK